MVKMVFHVCRSLDGIWMGLFIRRGVMGCEVKEGVKGSEVVVGGST